MSLLLKHFLFSILLVSVSTFPSSTTNQRVGRCRGGAVNYLVSVSSLRGCVEACDRDERCCHYSYHRSEPSHPDHTHCFLYSSEACDINNLMYSGSRSHWVSGLRTAASTRCPHSGVHMVLLRATR